MTGNERPQGGGASDQGSQEAYEANVNFVWPGTWRLDVTATTAQGVPTSTKFQVETK